MEKTNSTKSCFIRKVPIDYDGKKYIVLTIKTIKENQQYEIPIIIDASEYSNVNQFTWNRVNHYICTSKMKNYERKHTYLHQYLMNHKFDGTLYVDHINRIPQDNRKENLRLATQTEQNWNQKKRKRTLKLPENCGFEPDDIPTNIDFRPANGSHGDCFELIIKENRIRIFRKKTTRSKKVSLLEKLNEAKNILKETELAHPEWFERKCSNGELSEIGKKLYKSYFEILKLAHIEDPFNKYDEK